MSFSWSTRWQTLSPQQRATVYRALRIAPHPDPDEGFEAIIRPGASRRSVDAALGILQSLEGPSAPTIGALRVYLLHREGLSYQKIADDPRVEKYLTRTKHSTLESRRKIAFETVRAVKRYERTAPAGWFKFILGVADNR